MRRTYQFLHLQASKPFVWGYSDCALGMADWWAFLYGDDPAQHLRGTYDSALSCERACGWMTDPVSVVDECLSAVGGAPRIEQPKVGCVAVVAIATAKRLLPVGAILADTGVWGLRGLEQGVTTMNFRGAQPVAMWDIGYEA